VHVDRLGRPVPRRLPDLLQDPLARHNCPRLADEDEEQGELLGSERHLLSVEARDARCSVDLKGSRTQQAAPLAPTAATAGDGPHPGHELTEPERLDDIVVGAQLEAY